MLILDVDGIFGIVVTKKWIPKIPPSIQTTTVLYYCIVVIRVRKTGYTTSTTATD